MMLFFALTQLFSMGDLLNASAAAKAKSKTPTAAGSRAAEHDEFDISPSQPMDEDTQALLRDRETLTNMIAASFDSHMSRILNAEDKVRVG